MAVDWICSLFEDTYISTYGCCFCSSSNLISISLLVLICSYSGMTSNIYYPWKPYGRKGDHQFLLILRIYLMLVRYIKTHSHYKFYFKFKTNFLANTYFYQNHQKYVHQRLKIWLKNTLQSSLSKCQYIGHKNTCLHKSFFSPNEDNTGCNLEISGFVNVKIKNFGVVGSIWQLLL